MTNYYLYRCNLRVLYSRSIPRSMQITGYVSCMLRKQVSSPQQEVKNQKRMLWMGVERFFLDGQCSDDEYISAISFITPIRVVTYTTENDLCLRVIQKRKTIYMVFCICMQYKCLRIKSASMWYFIILNVFCKELISCVEIFPCTAIAPDVTQIYGSRPCKTKGCFVIIVVAEMTVLGRTGRLSFHHSL